MARPDFPTRFWSYVEKRGASDCWPWTRAIHSAGYGQTSRFENGKARMLRAHRAAFELTYGPIPDGLCVCHHCDNPACCNPSHLWLGTFADNNRDRKEKGRNGSPAFTGFSTNPPRGELNRHAKLTAEQVAQLRKRYRAGALNQRQTAILLGVRPGTINRIVRGLTWANT